MVGGAGGRWDYRLNVIIASAMSFGTIFQNISTLSVRDIVECSCLFRCSHSRSLGAGPLIAHSSCLHDSFRERLCSL